MIGPTRTHVDAEYSEATSEVQNQKHETSELVTTSILELDIPLRAASTPQLET